MEKYKKFVIKDNILYLGEVEYHRELVTDTKNISGGGWWQYSELENSYYFYGLSSDFGKVTFDILKNSIKDEQINKSDIYFSDEEYFSTAFIKGFKKVI